MTKRPVQPIDGSAGGTELTWPLALWELTGVNTSALPVSAALKVINVLPLAGDFITLAPPSLLTRSTLSAAAWRLANPQYAPLCTAPDATTLYCATIEVSIPAATTPGSYDLFGRIIGASETIIRKALAIVAVS